MYYPFKAILKGIWYSLPVQLLLLHIRRYPVLLLFWILMFATINGSFMNTFGARILFLYPEYLDKVDFISALMVGVGIAIFIMSWNITTFILHSGQFRFLATAAQPFLKYCVNNALLPIAFLVYYLIKMVLYNRIQEFLAYTDILILIAGFITGFLLSLLVAFGYFFAADRTIYRYMPDKMKEALSKGKKHYAIYREKHHPKGTIRVDWFITARLAARRPRYIGHYPNDFIERIFKQHHLVAVFSIMFAFASLIIIGYNLDNPYFQIPAASSISVFYAVLIAVAGALSYFLGSWSIFAFIAMFMVMDQLYKNNILDPRNKAYGLRYDNKNEFPAYNLQNLQKIANEDSIRLDSIAFIGTLEAWKAKQAAKKPIMVVVATSGGGIRASSFTFDVLQHLDSITGKNLMQQTALLTGASGGMIGAIWYRELYRMQQRNAIADRYHPRYGDAIGKDVLNAVFSSYVARDVLAPTSRFTYNNHRYNKDRGYAFEQELNANTFGWLDQPIVSYKTDEMSGAIPTAMMGCVITRDGRKILIGSRPLRFMMHHQKPYGYYKQIDPDVVDFQSFFKQQDAEGLRMLTALRMNATFPYILPNVMLPTNPIIDVMDAGFRDNTGVESTLRFLAYFKDWIRKNCRAVVVLQIRDKPEGGWRDPYESADLFELITKPALLTQTNVIRFQEYQQWSLWDWVAKEYGPQMQRLLFEYIPSSRSSPASLSFHLTLRERKDIENSLRNPFNVASFTRAKDILDMKPIDIPPVPDTINVSSY